MFTERKLSGTELNKLSHFCRHEENGYGCSGIFTIRDLSLLPLGITNLIFRYPLPLIRVRSLISPAYPRVRRHWLASRTISSVGDQPLILAEILLRSRPPQINNDLGFDKILSDVAKYLLSNRTSSISHQSDSARQHAEGSNIQLKDITVPEIEKIHGQLTILDILLKDALSTVQAVVLNQATNPHIWLITSVVYYLIFQSETMGIPTLWMFSWLQSCPKNTSTIICIFTRL